MRSHQFRLIVPLIVLVALMLAVPGSLVVARGVQLPPVQQRPTAEDDGPPILATVPPRPTPTPTRPAPPTPVPTTSPRPTAVPTSPPRLIPTPQPTQAPLPTVSPPDPQPAPPQLPDTEATLPPANIAPFLPGTNNRFEITLYTCPQGVDTTLDEAALLAACPLYTQNPPPDTIYFQLGDGAQQLMVPDLGHDGTFLFDNVTILPQFFIVEVFNPGYTDPVVFCGEGGNAHVQVPTSFRAIQPELSTFSNVDYTCSWFKVPLQDNTVRVLAYLCTAHPPANATFSWFWPNCTSESVHTGTQFTLEDLNGTRTSPANSTSVTWTDVAFDEAGTIRITRQTPEFDTMPYKVFCGEFNGGAEMTVTNHQVTVQQNAEPPPFEYVCRWYRYAQEADFTDSLQIPASVTMVAWMCPAGTDPNAPRTTLLATCTEANPGVDIWVTYPDGSLFSIPVTGSAPATAWLGLVPQGTLTMTEEIPPGYGPPLVDCVLEGVKGWNNDGNGVNGSVTWYFAWEHHVTCSWFNFPQGG